jgi:hypothetical protein
MFTQPSVILAFRRLDVRLYRLPSPATAAAPQWRCPFSTIYRTSTATLAPALLPTLLQLFFVVAFAAGALHHLPG